ncbi:hypothetical protein VL20_6504 [Microcystis panniformis FACHB-1757]|uniref:Uncharacterized protein n=1 Tax=Microcystis panniformis FACHB-1757 TaxID=1638788 RepID=A0A0K1SAS8_9CHRO|nr:hypothetical protein VL20_20 [Microcystis panniformis FACHB-1757]AKV71219.1 hypothetical protein VL20_6504 [Microcystis panniformis FACHB-1757]
MREGSVKTSSGFRPIAICFSGKTKVITGKVEVFIRGQKDGAVHHN